MNLYAENLLERASTITYVHENGPMMFVKFFEMLETQNTVSIFWAVSVLSNSLSILKAFARCKLFYKKRHDFEYYLRRVSNQDCSIRWYFTGLQLLVIFPLRLAFFLGVIWQFDWIDYTSLSQQQYGIKIEDINDVQYLALVILNAVVAIGCTIHVIY